MKLSARNQIRGNITQLRKGAVNSEIVIQLPGGEELVSVITNTSAERMNLEIGKEAYAIIKASNVMVGIDD
ncbi:TOBE domain-containing protein [Sediminispirochaeta smaragdinae]|jgi:molybdopterin-binding protein|uniref:TOBE domain protein n=1 Tax=Sediminispirochaeta smaragdinae (strain DSM 11293 / JCM 15392 / SEBR 4228) TaxID=573413 RepID=E1R332_SEDSS|nr:molybdopterin-binding protein [Sediminispirochaeta smaragdinae]ADK81218.1 TOBE domain protein [Sediminispirochaeta smaragdinae DSM 11293]